MHPNTQGSIWMESGMAGKNLAVLVENKLNKSEMHLCSKKANILGCICQQAEGDSSFPTLSTAETTYGLLCTILGSLGTRDIGIPEQDQ